MSHGITNATDVDHASSLLPSGRVVRCLLILQEAAIRAQETRSNRWQFAVEIAELRAAGLRHTDLRWLVSEGYVERAEERTRLSDKKRVFVRVGNLALGPKICFVLTGRGFELARSHPESADSTALDTKPSLRGDLSSARPRWDRDRRELRLNDRIIKKFRLPAENQERILAAFEEDGWPVRIDDPLSRTHDIDPKTRLHESIKALNRNQTVALLRFSGDGTGQGVIWEARFPRTHAGLPQSDRGNRYEEARR